MPKNRSEPVDRITAPHLSELEAPHFQWIRGLLSVCEITGSDPASAIQPDGHGGDVRVHCALVWWLVTGLHQHPLKVARWLGAPPRAIERAIDRMRILVRSDPEVHEWAQRLQLQTRPTAPSGLGLPSSGETVFIETQENPRKMGMAALWMTVETGMKPLELWGTEMGTKDAAKWATLWWLSAGKGLTHDEVCTTLGLHPREALRRLNRLTQLAAMRPDVFDWMASITNTKGDAATT